MIFQTQSLTPSIRRGGAIMLPKAVSVFVYAITPNLWRWEIRRGSALLRCGTALTSVAAELDVNQLVNA